MGQIRLHPAGTPQVARIVAALHHAVAAYLERHPALVLTQTPRGILVNGRPPASRDFATVTLQASLQSLFLEAGIRSVFFHPGVGPEETAAFLQALAHRFWDLRDPRRINLRLREQHVLRIGVNEEEDPAAAGPAPTPDEPAVPAGRLRFERALEALRALAALHRDAPPDTRTALRRTAETLLEPFRDDPRAALRARDALAAAPELAPDWLQAPAAPPSGSLRDAPLAAVFASLAAPPRSGLLVLNFEGRVARVWIEEGLVVAADFEGRRDADAFRAFASLPRGEYLFQPGETAPERRLRSPAAPLLEAPRAADSSPLPLAGPVS
ncbi:MAG TPA: DUF4388 domain-containing protein [Planctomycetota bacterium]|nr:DUF4388 domain-containing protein [Planctomycetota bacterium]